MLTFRKISAPSYPWPSEPLPWEVRNGEQLVARVASESLAHLLAAAPEILDVVGDLLTVARTANSCLGGDLTVSLAPGAHWRTRLERATAIVRP